ncbi:Aluminum-activated malate transporter 12 [Acorus calamus]|uniref:Aluminum-activated malate transporter 12 n=1 Tax=Acorus calamus TaxID=4465 RepID=A0AAV9EW56_ACOCL|nr:Aluminum-activated malate transporter 12 [Acorus calamus]
MQPKSDPSIPDSGVAITINEGDEIFVPVTKKRSVFCSWAAFHPSNLIANMGTETSRRLIHGAKVGFALVVVSLLYMLEVVHDKLGDNAMWAVMTVVVVFEFSSGATISKGVNRAIGTTLGGGLGCSVALLAQQVGGTGKAITIGTSVFFISAAATYTRLQPKIKKRYDYGFLIFILTFNLVAVSGVRGEEIWRVATDRLSSIMMGITICYFISLFVLPVWASDELHKSIVSKFDKLANSIEGCMEDYFKSDGKKDTKASSNLGGCMSVIYSKTADEALANFAIWEPWHGRFGYGYPYKKCLRILELLRELAASTLSLQSCLKSKLQPSLLSTRAAETCQMISEMLVFMLRELGEDIFNMRMCRPHDTVAVRIQSLKTELATAVSASNLSTLVGVNSTMRDGLSVASFVFVFMEVLDKVEVISKEVEELGKLARFEQRELMLH